ncbi:hypothetical protein [Bacillus cereus]|uniref:hypothetical protein n=1 Tax=Bacillus cereus TaxID=1396 RepID=UPI0011A560D8|nr:hypothetical protein [Bacillus cereus]
MGSYEAYLDSAVQVNNETYEKLQERSTRLNEAEVHISRLISLLDELHGSEYEASEEAYKFLYGDDEE